MKEFDKKGVINHLENIEEKTLKDLDHYGKQILELVNEDNEDKKDIKMALETIKSNLRDNIEIAKKQPRLYSTNEIAEHSKEKTEFYLVCKGCGLIDVESTERCPYCGAKRTKAIEASELTRDNIIMFERRMNKQGEVTGYREVTSEELGGIDLDSAAVNQHYLKYFRG